jgi:hypothetical protein
MRQTFFLAALCLFALVNAQSIRSLGASDEEFWSDFTKLYVEFQSKKLAEVELASLKTLYDRPNWEHRESFKALMREMLRKRIVEPEAWIESVALTMHWDSESFASQSRWWLETSEMVKRSSRQALMEYLHTASGLSRPNTENGQITLFHSGPLRWSLLYGDATLLEDSESTLYRIEDGVLKGKFKNDSTQVDSIYGVYDPRSNMLTLESGRIDWYRAGYSYGEVFTTIRDVQLNLKETGFVVDTATLYSMYYITEPLLGRFEERMGTRTDPEKAIYPRFVAFRSDLVIPDFFKNVSYEGGFSLIGQRFFASGNEQSKAKFTFRNRESREVVVLAADRFVISLDGLQSKETLFTLRVGSNDSIFHGNVQSGFDPSTGDLSIYRPDNGLSLKPFVDTYHKVSMDFDQLRWNTEELKVLFGGLNMGSGSPMTLESDQYYRNERYAALQGFENKNPLIKLSELSKENPGLVISLRDVAVGMGMPAEPCERLMMDYHIKGFVRYNSERKELEILPKTTDYVLNHKKKRDFDVIRFESVVPEGMNAELDLLTNDVVLAGVDRIWLSDSQKVSLHPTSGEILLHKGLDFDFDGLIRAGRFEFFGRTHQFHYEDFSFQMPQVDSMRFYVPSFVPNENGERPLVRVRNTLQDISGDLYIDYPDNKSSTRLSPEYPIFKSGKGARIYYDRIRKGVYPKATFFADLDAFTIDSLDNASTEGLGFLSTMVTAGIYEPFRQMIKVQEDYSLGFSEKTNAEGWNTYPSTLANSGRSMGEVKLSLDGFRLVGDISFKNVTSSSQRFDLYPDSTRGIGTYQLKGVKSVPRGVGYPNVQGSDAANLWLPYQVKWKSKSRSTQFNLYENRPATASGILTYSPERLELNGVISVNYSELAGQKVNLFSEWIQSENANFRVRASNDVAWGFSMKNAQSEIDFTSERGYFKLLSGQSVDFPRNQYRAEFDEANWQILEKSVSLNKAGVDDARLTSLHPGQDGLSFGAKRARFLLLPSQLDAYSVPHIDVADSRVFPDSGHVVVFEDANMKQLTNARISASRVGQYHNISSASLKIQGKNDLYGSGIYEYTDLNQKVWKIPMGRIDVDTTGQLYGLGEIPAQDDFYLSPHFQYVGAVKIFAQDPQILVEGKVRISAQCPALETDWIIAKNKIDPFDILFVLPDPDTATPAQRVYSGIYLMQDSATPYTAFVRRNNPNVAVELFSSKGVLYYDEERKSYIVSSISRVKDPEASDNWFEFNTANCTVTGYGKLTLGAKMGQVSMDSYGKITHKLKSGELFAKSAVLVDFMFPDELLKPIRSKIETSGGIGTGITNDAFDEVVRQIFDPKDRMRFLRSGLNDRLPKELRQTFVLGELDFNWNSELRAFRSNGYIDVYGIAGDPVHKGIQGVMELRKRRGGDEFTLYLRPNDELYLTYKKGSLRFYSSDNSLLQDLAKLDPKKRTITPKKGEAFYTILPTTGGAMKRYLDGIQEQEEDAKKRSKEKNDEEEVNPD